MNHYLNLEIEVLIKIFDQLNTISFCVCDEDFIIKYLNKYLEKNLHIDNFSKKNSLLDYIELSEEELKDLKEDSLTILYEKIIKPDNRAFNCIFYHIKNKYVFIGELSNVEETDILSSISSISNEANNMARELRRKNRELKVANNRIEELTRKDPLTGLFNRRYLSEHLSRALNLAARKDLDLSLIMIDIDYFKNINDKFGHDIGDKVLKKLAEIYTDAIRNEDFLARFGGEEFIIVLESTKIEEAVTIAEKLRVKLEKAEIIVNKTVTASFGITQFKTNDTQESIIKRADIALYQAKQKGRNCCSTNP